MLPAADFLHAVGHSCEPNVIFDMSSHDRSKWHVRAVQLIEQGTARKLRHRHLHAAYSDKL